MYESIQTREQTNNYHQLTHSLTPSLSLCSRGYLLSPAEPTINTARAINSSKFSVVVITTTEEEYSYSYYLTNNSLLAEQPIPLSHVYKYNNDRKIKDQFYRIRCLKLAQEDGCLPMSGSLVYLPPSLADITDHQLRKHG